MRRRRTLGLASVSGAVVIFAATYSQADSRRLPRIEMMRADVLSRKTWKSTDVKVAGLYLGMSRADAAIAARREGFQLMQYGPPLFDLRPCTDYAHCFLAGPHGYDADDVEIRLGKSQEIVEIELTIREPDTRGRVLRGMTGKTRQFFLGPYNDAQRIDLFGPETMRESVQGGYGPKMNDTRYVYAERGIAITVTPSPMTAPIPDLVNLILFPPAHASR